MSSERSILRSAGILGVSQVIVMLLSLVKSKVLAVLLGPEGVGLIGALQSTMNLLQGAIGLGVENSAVRDIAKSSSSSNGQELSTTVKVQRTIVWITGGLGFIITLVLAPQLSWFTFDSFDYTWEIRLLSFAVLFNLVKSGQYALLQGMRRIKEIAKISVFGAAVGALISVPIFYLLELDGVAVFLVVLSLSQLLVSWYYSRKIQIEKVEIKRNELKERSKSMIKLGLAFMGGTFITLLTAYAIKVLIIKNLGMESLGIYQAAFVISGLFVNTLLSAMGKDFYPRLTAVAFDAQKENRTIQEQVSIGLTLAAPGILFTIALAPYIIPLLYSNAFTQAVDLLRWISLGFFLRLFSWPLSYLIIARAKTGLFLLIELISNVLHVLLVFLLMEQFGLLGIALSFLGLYVFYGTFLTLILYRINGFAWDRSNILDLLFYSVIFGLSLVLLFQLEGVWGIILVSGLASWIAFRAYQRILVVMNFGSGRELLEFVLKKFKAKEKHNSKGL